MVFGRSKLVGMPLSVAITHMGGTVQTIHTRSPKMPPEERIVDSNVDVVISAVGVPNFIDCDKFNFAFDKFSATFIDVGINRNDAGKLCGDLCNTGAFTDDMWNNYTSVPGGVGTTTVVNVAYNVLKLVYGERVKF
jgi:methylenetetrahydrofolate dehydrogenase (NADP+)/methenyltetrahydrofolate cyclohydrolase